MNSGRIRRAAWQGGKDRASGEEPAGPVNPGGGREAPGPVGNSPTREESLASQEVVLGQAQGILMERYRITAGQAAAFLATASDATSRTVRETAAILVHTGDIDL